MPMTTRRWVWLGLAVVWLAVVLAWAFDLGVSASPLLGWVAFLVTVAPAVLVLHLLGKRFGATRSPRRPPDA
ncbi:hypothetical protein NHN26_07080 [Rhodovulum tesquicola]|uniref:hypothetical protein n=1 Tax=Rhodovulum tesquicola TaxID=540254 RepID=UPI002097CA8C|nr:hypothetical protein [Rhodovulum tesquicola]MCO8144985.1 hypothetical protein [Rhodovulum tesquicola]